MERDFGSRLFDRHFNLQLPNLNSSSVPLDVGEHQSKLSAYISCCTNVIIPNQTLPSNAFSKPPELPMPVNKGEPNGWFNCLPRFRPSLNAMSSPHFKEKVLSEPHRNCENVGVAQKRFLVFDQSGDKTSLYFSAGTGDPMQYPTSWSPQKTCNSIADKTEFMYHSDQVLTDESNEDHDHGTSDAGSEFHEDTEELNALLYSDDDGDYTEDDEVTSTCHTPSRIILTSHDNQDQVASSGEEVTTERPKQVERGSDIPLSSLIDSSSSMKRKKPQVSEYEDDAQSSCGNVRRYPCSAEMDISSCNKRMKIRETILLLQQIIPGAKGKDGSDVLEEAINYLKSLKQKVWKL